MKPNIYSGRDSAGFEAGKIQVYYGCEQIDPTSGERMFKVWKNGKEVFSATNSQLLEVSFGEGPGDLLIAGLSLYLSK